MSVHKSKPTGIGHLNYLSLILELDGEFDEKKT